MKKILVIDESQLFREYLGKKLTEFGFEVTLAVNGLDGSTKMRNYPPDLIVMDYYLSRNSSLELLTAKKADKNTAAIPIIMASAKVDRDKVLQVAQYNVKRFFTKPIRIDVLFRAISEILKVTLKVDNTPCVIEAHFNDEIIFVEVAKGLNREKIELLKYRLTELIDLYEVVKPKILVIMSNLEIDSEDSLKLSALFSEISDAARGRNRNVKVLTTNKFVAGFLSSRREYSEIQVTNNIESVMDGLLGRKLGPVIEGEGPAVQEGFLRSAEPKKDRQENIHMRFYEQTADARVADLGDLDGDVRISVVDDDIVIQELIKAALSDTKFEIRTFNDGSEFIADGEAARSDLIFLDLMMPKMDGFQVMEALSEQKLDVPIIILSALSQRDTVVKALKFGVKSYMTKPLRPDGILRKTTEILRMNF